MAIFLWPRSWHQASLVICTVSFNFMWSIFSGAILSISIKLYADTSNMSGKKPEIEGEAGRVYKSVYKCKL